jgi:protein TonB
MRGFFEELVYSKRQRKSPFFLPVSAAIHASVVGAAIAASTLAPPTLPVVAFKEPVLVPLPAVRADIAVPVVTPKKGAGGGPPKRGTAFVAPTSAPTSIPVPSPSEADPSDIPALCVGGCVTGPGASKPGGEGGDGSALGSGGGGPRVVDARTGIVSPPRKLKDVKPVYPPLAASSHLQGRVVLECTIGTDGRVSSIRVLKSLPILERAAIDAVQQWVYTPTLLDGVPVAVLMSVTVTFTIPR